MNKKYLIFMLSLLLFGQSRCASFVRGAIRCLNESDTTFKAVLGIETLAIVGFALVSDRILAYRLESNEEDGPLPMLLEDGDKLDPYYTELGLWAQERVGVPLKKRLFVVVGDNSKKIRQAGLQLFVVEIAFLWTMKNLLVLVLIGKELPCCMRLCM
ncbi:hypothetical protein HN446_05340 [bacterium]|jgi:hypothetical protein|nr:hypothetical protein [bacterium]